MSVSIAGLNRADVLAALYNAAQPHGMGFLHYDPTPMKRKDAERLLAQSDYFDYIKGRVMKISLPDGDDEIVEFCYDRDNGEGAMQRVIDALREEGQP